MVTYSFKMASAALPQPPRRRTIKREDDQPAFSPRQRLVDEKFFGGALSSSSPMSSQPNMNQQQIPLHASSPNSTTGRSSSSADAYLQSLLLQQQTQAQLVERFSQVRQMEANKMGGAPAKSHEEEQEDGMASQVPTFNDLLFKGLGAQASGFDQSQAGFPSALDFNGSVNPASTFVINNGFAPGDALLPSDMSTPGFSTYSTSDNAQSFSLSPPHSTRSHSMELHEDGSPPTQLQSTSSAEDSPYHGETFGMPHLGMNAAAGYPLNGQQQPQYNQLSPGNRDAISMMGIDDFNANQSAMNNLANMSGGWMNAFPFGSSVPNFQAMQLMQMQMNAANNFAAAATQQQQQQQMPANRPPRNSAPSNMNPEHIMQLSQFGGFAPSAFMAPLAPAPQFGRLAQMPLSALPQPPRLFDAPPAQAVPAAAASMCRKSSAAPPKPDDRGSGDTAETSKNAARGKKRSSPGGRPNSAGKSADGDKESEGDAEEQADEEEGTASKKIKSETSLAHKLSVHARSLKAESASNALDAKWDILTFGSEYHPVRVYPGCMLMQASLLPFSAFDNVQSVMTQLYFRQQERLMRQAAQPSLAQVKKEAEEDESSSGGKGKKRRKSRANGEDSDGADGKASRKVPHNAIERRYRNNINDRIAALRNAVPALRNLRPKSNGGSVPVVKKNKGKDGADDLVDGVSAATKLNKATILSKATEYIQYLKSREVALTQETEGLKELVRSLRGGEDLLRIWLNEMNQTMQERKEERARQQAAGLIPKDEDEEDTTLDLEDAMDEDDEEGDDATSPNSSGRGGAKAGNYMMAAFLGFTVVGGGADLAASNHMAESSSLIDHAHAAARDTGARVIGASHQLLKRANIAPASSHHLDHVASHTLVFEILRFVSLLGCVAIALYPLYMLFLGRKDASTTEAQSAKRRAKLAEAIEKKKEMLSALAADDIKPRDVAKLLRKFVDAPSTEASAAIGIVKEIAIGALPGALRSLVSGRAPIDRLQAEKSRVWLRLLEVETAWGPFAEPSTLKKTHTIVKMRNTRPLATDELCGPARVHATMALALGRLGTTDNAIGRMMRSAAIGRWHLAHQAQLVRVEEDHIRAANGEPVPDDSQRWLSQTLQIGLEDALAICPSESVASAASYGAEPDMRTFLATPLLLVSNALQMQALREVWYGLFPSIVNCAGPSQLLCKDEDGIISVAAFMRGFNEHRIASGLRIGAAEDEYTKAELTAKISDITFSAARGTPARTLARITLGAWSFFLGNAALAQRITMGLNYDLQRGTSLLGTANAAQALVKLVQGDSTPLPAANERMVTAGDNATLSLVTASLSWLSFLRLFANSSSANVVLEEAFQLRRTLARAALSERKPSYPDSRPATPSLDPHSERSSINGEAQEADSTLADAKDAMIDLLSSICQHVGRRALRGKDTLSSAAEDWNSDSGVDFI